MLICIDVGNTQIHGGIHNGSEFTHSFRFNSKQGWSADQLGMTIKSFLAENGLSKSEIKGIVVGSVAPSLDHHLQNASIKYFGLEPYLLKAGSKTGISLSKFKAPLEVGADLIAGCVAVADLHPNENCIITDLGTATTVVAIDANKAFLGGVIIPGVQTQCKAISEAAEKLFHVEINKPDTCIGLTTSHSIRSGIYYGHLGALKEVIARLNKECFKGQKSKVIATGGFAKLFKEESVFDEIVDNLVLLGLLKVYEKNHTS